MPVEDHPETQELLEVPIATANEHSDHRTPRLSRVMAGPNLFNTGSQTSVISECPPSYHSQWEDAPEVPDSKQPEEDVRPLRFLQTRAATFSSLTGVVARENYGKFQRWLTRSGSGKSGLSYEEVDIEKAKIYQRFSGWRGGVLGAAVSTGSVLLINLLFTIWAAATSKSGLDIGVIWEGKCSTVQTADLWLHIGVNVMGTLLLGSSNYTMQCLTSPTRKEVDAAHRVGKHLDIGLPSPRNLQGWKKKLMFGLLVCSTLPLHFLWNSAVFTTTQLLDYQVYVVTPDFFNHSAVDCSQNVSITYNFDLDDGTGPNWGYGYYESTPLVYNDTQGNITYPASSEDWWQSDACSTANTMLYNATVPGKLQRLNNQDCIDAYGPGNGLMSKRGNVLVVTKQQPANSNATMLMQFKYETFVSNYTGQNWVCSPQYLEANNYQCNYKSLDASSWTLGNILPTQIPPTGRLESNQEWEIDYCLSQPTDIGGHCMLQYSAVIMICVLIANAVKFSVIFFFLKFMTDPVLATIGDGIASFLERPDPHTVERPFLDRNEARRFHRRPNRQVVAWKPRKLRWWQAPSRTRWILTLFFCSVAIITTICLLEEGNQTAASSSGASPYSLGFGTYNAAAVLDVGPGTGQGNSAAEFNSNSILIMMVAIANLPQVIVSCLYFAYNTVYTSMVSAYEWSRFTHHRKTLRTTDPVGLQRSTYWLSLPWTYALPLAIASSVLHWLISQSLFIARSEVLDTNGQTEPISYMSVAYSPLAILLALLFGLSMVLVMILNGLRELKGGILVGNNSLAIAAACQRPERDDKAYAKPVRWGAVQQPDSEKGEPGHCCFTSEEVEMPREGEIYI